MPKVVKATITSVQYIVMEDGDEVSMDSINNDMANNPGLLRQILLGLKCTGLEVVEQGIDGVQMDLLCDGGLNGE